SPARVGRGSRGRRCPTASGSAATTAAWCWARPARWRPARWRAARRAGGPSAAGEDEQQVDLAGDLAAHPGDAVAPAGPGREPAHLHGHVEGVAGGDLAPEPGAVDPAEQRQLAGEPV